MDRIGLDSAARKSSGRTLYTLQVMLHYLQEASEGAPLFVACQLLEHDDKRMRVWLEMRAGRDGPVLAAAAEAVAANAELFRQYEGFAAPVELAPDAPEFDRLLATSGRDPAWTAS